MKNKSYELFFTPHSWDIAAIIAGIRRGNGKYNPRRMYQGFAPLTRKSARKSSINSKIW